MDQHSTCKPKHLNLHRLSRIQYLLCLIPPNHSIPIQTQRWTWCPLYTSSVYPTNWTKIINFVLILYRRFYDTHNFISDPSMTVVYIIVIAKRYKSWSGVEGEELCKKSQSNNFILLEVNLTTFFYKKITCKLKNFHNLEGLWSAWHIRWGAVPDHSQR